MTKSELRPRYLARRAALSEADYRRKNERLAEQLRATYSLASFGTVHCFIPSTRQREVDTWPIIRRLWALPTARVVAPRCAADRTLTHHEIRPDTPLKNNRWGIPEPPVVSPTVVPQEIDLVLVPLLAFDRRGHRVGYGQGFYDRCLAACRTDTLKVGLSLFEPVGEIEDVGEGDILLDACVVPGRVWVFN